jgi:2-keto-4-pentenoate hydratase
MNPKYIEKFADIFYDLFYTGTWNNNTGQPISALSIDESYSVQDLVAKKRIDRGEKVVGYKVGCTSSSIQSQFGLDEPIFGRLFQPHIFEDSRVLDQNDYVNCAVEPEMVIKICKDLEGETLPDSVLIDAIEYISPGIEIHNYKFWNAPPTLQELISSNGIHAGLVIGNTKISPENFSFKQESFMVYKDDKLIEKGDASEIMGGPLNSLRWLIGKLTSRKKKLKSGSIVIPGSPVKLINIDQDTKLTVIIENVGKVVSSFSHFTH